MHRRPTSQRKIFYVKVPYKLSENDGLQVEKMAGMTSVVRDDDDSVSKGGLAVSQAKSSDAGKFRVRHDGTWDDLVIQKGKVRLIPKQSIIKFVPSDESKYWNLKDVYIIANVWDGSDGNEAGMYNVSATKSTAYSTSPLLFLFVRLSCENKFVTNVKHADKCEQGCDGRVNSKAIKGKFNIFIFAIFLLVSSNIVSGNNNNFVWELYFVSLVIKLNYDEHGSKLYLPFTFMLKTKIIYENLRCLKYVNITYI